MRQSAREVGHPFSLAYALHHTSWLYLCCRLGARLGPIAAEQIAVSAEQSFALWHASGTFFKGAGRLLQGELEEAMPLLVNGLHAWQATDSELMITYQYATVGEAYTKANQFADARQALDSGLAIAEKNDECCHEAELRRLVGELLLAESSDQAGAEYHFHQAIETSRRQKSRAWELRSTVSLARLWQQQGRIDEALDALAAIYGTYTEGFTTPDLMDAKGLLAQLG